MLVLQSTLLTRLGNRAGATERDNRHRRRDRCYNVVVIGIIVVIVIIVVVISLWKRNESLLPHVLHAMHTNVCMHACYVYPCTLCVHALHS